MSVTSAWFRPEPRWWRQFHTSKAHPGSWRRQLGPCCQLGIRNPWIRPSVTPVFTWEWT